MDLNRAFIIGNMTRDPELRSTPSGVSVCSFGIATNRSYTDAAGTKKEQVEFHNIVAWGKLAEICSQYLTKGRKVFIEGRMQTRDWEGQDGTKKQKTEIIAENMIILDRAGAPAAGQPAKGFAGKGAMPDTTNPLATQAPDEEIHVEDIPF